MIFASTFVLASALAASAATINVVVGDQNGLVYNPSSVTAQLNDTISFQFVSKNHTVTQSTFAAPCTRMAQGVDSGFQAVANGSTTVPSWSFTINDPSTPLWFYCAQKNPANHCQAGMVFAVNPTADKTFDAFQAAAKASNGTGSASGGSGGGNGGSSGTASGGASPAATTAGTGAGAGTGGGTGAATGAGTGTAGTAGAGATKAPNGAIVSRGLSSAGAVSFVSLVAAVAGMML